MILKKISTSFLIVFALMATLAFAQESAIKARAWTPKPQVFLGESFDYFIEIESKDSGLVSLPYTMNNLGIFELENFEVGALEKKDSLYVQRWRYHLNTFLSGKFGIPNQIIEFSKDSLIWSDTLDVVEVEVLSNINSEMQDIFESEDVIKAPFNYWPWVWGSIVLIVIATLIFYYIKRAKAIKANIKMTPFEKAHKQLSELKEAALLDSEDSTDHIEYYTKLSFIYREYLENEIGIEALESTTKELTQKLKVNIYYPKSLRDSTRQFLNLCDGAKFARFTQDKEQGEFALSFVEEVLQKVLRVQEEKK